MFDLQHDKTCGLEIDNNGEVYERTTHRFTFEFFGWSCSFEMHRWAHHGHIVMAVAPQPLLDLEQQPFYSEMYAASPSSSHH